MIDSHLLNEQDGDCINLKEDRYPSRAVKVFTRALSLRSAIVAVWSRYLVRQSALLLERRRASLAFCVCVCVCVCVRVCGVCVCVYVCVRSRKQGRDDKVVSGTS